MCEQLNTLLDEAIKVCESEGIPFVAAYGLDVINVADFQPASTPDRLKRTFNALMSGVKQTKRRVEIQA